MARFSSHAVDYPKTGVPVNFKSLPLPPQSERPDFLSGEGSNRRLTDRFYRSQKILGILFRGVLIDDYTADRHHGHIQPSDGVKIWKCLLQTNVDFELPSDDVVDEMKHLLEAYSDRLFAIAQAYSLSKHVDSHLSEEELVSGTIMAHWADHNKRREAVMSMNVKVSGARKEIALAIFIRFSCRHNSSRRQYVRSLYGWPTLIQTLLRTVMDGILMSPMTSRTVK